MEELSVSDAAFQADAPHQTADQRSIKRPRSEAQRKAKNERDRSRRQEHKAEFERLQNMDFQHNQIALQLEGLKEENKRLHTRIKELENTLPERAAPDRNYRTRTKNLLLHGHGNQPMALIGGENQIRVHLPLMPELCISTSVQTPGMAPESVIDKETVTNQFTMRVPFLFVASKTEEVTSILLRGKCSASPEGCFRYLFEWIPQQTNLESGENFGRSPIDDMGLIQNLAPPPTRCGAQAKFPIKFLLWNSVGALNANRKRVVMDLINGLQPAVLVLTETRLSRARAEEIIGTFPFDDHRVTPNLGYVGGMWLLWRSAVVEVQILSLTEQEIHALIKEPQKNQNPNPCGFLEDFRNFESFEEIQSFLSITPEQVSNSEPVTEAQWNTAQSSSDVSMAYADELVEDFTKKLDAKDKNEVDFSDFKGLKEEMETIGIKDFPPSLAPIDELIKKTYGDITADSRQSACVIRTCYILLCSVIKEMGELKLEQVDKKKMLFWRDGINSGLSNELSCKFAIDHLKSIARAYYGLKAWIEGGNDQKDLENIEQRMSELKIELCSLEERHAKKLEEQNSEVRKQCIHVAEQFSGKPLSTYLFSSVLNLG